MDERLAFIADHRRGELGMSALCRAYAISRKTGYKLLARYRGEGPTGLADRSRAPHHHPQAIPADVQTSVVTLRTAHPHWGPRKLRARLQRQHPTQSWPALSSIGALLRQRGLTRPAPRAARGAPRAVTASTGPNDVWTIDFKGWFRTGDGQRCDPLTVVDDASRYLLGCTVVAQATGPYVQRCLERLFRHYGLPAILRSDNGPPFATSQGALGLSRLAVWWIKLGIQPERIAPGHPEQNPRHERLHRTLKAETACPPAATRCAQQQAFDTFQYVYNHERPHEALGQRPPALVYTPSPRGYPTRLSTPEYAAAFVVRRVRHAGEIKWRGEPIFLSRALTGEPVGLQEVADGCWRVCYGPLVLGCLHADTHALHPVA